MMASHVRGHYSPAAVDHMISFDLAGDQADGPGAHGLAALDDRKRREIKISLGLERGLKLR